MPMSSSQSPSDPDRDRIIISHGHTSPGVYAALGRIGFYPIEAAITNFRKAGIAFEGHVEKGIPGIEWNTGNLGQGLSAGCGFALGAKVLKRDLHVFVAMGCGEQQKGQISEARRFAIKYGLDNLTVIIDYNCQTDQWRHPGEIMPQNIAKNFQSDGWRVIEVGRPSLPGNYTGLSGSRLSEHPTAIIAHTIMGKGVSFMEGKEEFHGRALNLDEYKKAIQELGVEDDLDRYRQVREKRDSSLQRKEISGGDPHVQTGIPRDYEKDQKMDNRSAFGNALVDLAKANLQQDGSLPIVVFDCDLAPSTKTTAFAKQFPGISSRVGFKSTIRPPLPEPFPPLVFSPSSPTLASSVWTKHIISTASMISMEQTSNSSAPIMASMWARMEIPINALTMLE